MKSFFIVTGALLGGVLIIVGVIWLGMANWGKWSAEYGPEIPVNFQARANGADEALKNAREPYSRWVALGDAALWKAQPPTENEARMAANELLSMLENYKDDWNYGNAIHKANSALGRIALRQGDKAAARNYLLASAKSKGSPQMNSFGPNMVFAKEMLEAGEKDAVLEYLQLCGKFWSMEDGRLAVWTKMINEGSMPKIFREFAVLILQSGGHSDRLSRYSDSSFYAVVTPQSLPLRSTSTAVTKLARFPHEFRT